MLLKPARPVFGGGRQNKAQGGACVALGQPIISTQTSPAPLFGAGDRIFSQICHREIEIELLNLDGTDLSSFWVAGRIWGS